MKSSKVEFKILELKENENSKNYKITVCLPISIGWIDDLIFNIKTSKGIKQFKIKHQKNDSEKVYFESEIEIDTWAIYRYYFSCKINNNYVYISKDGNIVNDISRDEMGKLSVNFEVPDWAKGKIMYHIFVDRYRRESKEELWEMPNRTIHKTWNEEIILGPNKDGIWNADFYGGDLLGIEKTLDYIKSLGVSIIYLSPVVMSQSNHRYDAADYENVDPYAGCNEDLKNLCDKAHEKGMKVILDAVFNHTGNDSKYFNEFNTFDTVGAYQSDLSPYKNFYRVHEENGKKYFHYWWGMPNLPVCNGFSKDWQDYILGENGIIDKWFQLGIDGLRLDVADELTDDFIEKIRVSVKRNKEDGFILGEVWKNPMRMNRTYIESGKGMDTVMNYFLIDALIRYFKYSDVTKLSYIINDIKNEYPIDTINSLMNFTSTHDISRAIDIFSSSDFDEYSEWAWNLKNSSLEWCKQHNLSREDYIIGRKIYEAYIFTLAFMPGNLSIFYGDEVGLEGIGNLLNRKTYPWDKRDKKLLEFFRYIGRIRKNETFLENASLNVFDINNKYIMFERLGENESSLVTVSRVPFECNFSVPRDYCETDEIYTLKRSKKGLLNPYGGVVLKKKK